MTRIPNGFWMLYDYQNDSFSMNNEQIAKILRNVAAAYAIKDEKKHRFQIIAYQKASDLIEHTTTQLKDLFKEGKLDDIPGIGTSIKASLVEIFKNGSSKHLNSIINGIPEAVFPLLDIPSFGPKKAFKLVSEFKLKNPSIVVDDIKKLAEKGKIATLETFGEKSQADILQAIYEYKTGTTKSARMVLPYAQEIADKLISYLKHEKSVKKISPLGSLRRRVSTIGDVDLAVASSDPQKTINYFVNYPYKERVLEKGDVSASILLTGGKHIDLLVLDPSMWGSLLQHFTGSKHHNVALRELAIKKGYSLSERGIKIAKSGELKKFTSEEDFYKFLGLKWIPPEIREDEGEIDLALKNELPRLVELKDIKGDLHIHSSYPIEPSHDMGQSEMQVMIDKAKSLGYEYIGFSEHNPSIMNHTKDQVYSILSKRKEKIEQLKLSNKNIRIINLLEVDILASGELAVDEKSSTLLDAMLVSIHSSFNMPMDKMTERILKGLARPKAKIFSHPSGRLLNQRPGYEISWEKLFMYALENNKALEINSWPTRLDLSDTLVKQAKEKGIKFVIDTDSHEVSQMDNMHFGVDVARRGWCEKKDILNTLPADKFVNWLKA